MSRAHSCATSSTASSWPTSACRTERGPRPMKARKVAILESRLGKELSDLVARRGGVPVHAPALAELPDLDPKAISALLASLDQQPADVFIFQTGIGTRA